MKDLLTEIHQVKKLSEEINSMSEIIEDVAFQTNFLALNASVCSDIKRIKSNYESGRRSLDKKLFN